VSYVLWNVPESDHAMSIYSTLQMTASELWIVKCSDADHAMFIYFSLQMIVCELWIVEYARE
jgi:hypothetical protein